MCTKRFEGFAWRLACVLSVLVMACGEEQSSALPTPPAREVPEGECAGLRPGDTCELEDPHLSLLWDNIHEGRYDAIPGAIDELKAFLEGEPDDFHANKTIGFLRSWQLGEMYRSDAADIDLAEIVTGLEEASSHFGRALDHKYDARLIIFKTTNEYMAAKQMNNADAEAQAKEAFITAVEDWPELSYFVGGTMLSIFSQPGDDDFNRALEYMWASVDLCAGEAVDRQNPGPQMRAKIKDVPREGAKRACSNAWIAPHSYEGFWLFFGDLLTKKGDFELARVMYEQSRLAEDFDSWSFKDVLEQRLENMESNQASFSLPVAAQDPKYHPVAEWSCTVCHQR